MNFRSVWLINPPGLFGLPDGDRVVLPPGVETLGPVLDTRSGKFAAHGTLSIFRDEDKKLEFNFEYEDQNITCNDNFLSCELNANSAQEAYDNAAQWVAKLCQSLSVQYGMRFSARFLSIEDSAGVVQRVQHERQMINMLQLTVYDVNLLSSLMRKSAEWAVHSDEISTKALLYFEHACLLQEFSISLTPLSAHAGLSQALAFLQLYKALSVIIGEPKTDKDYQRRATQMGLPKDFLQKKVKPLYTVRCEEDVAHYSRDFPEPGIFLERFKTATAVFNEALTAYLSKKMEANSG